MVGVVDDLCGKYAKIGLRRVVLVIFKPIEHYLNFVGHRHLLYVTVALDVNSIILYLTLRQSSTKPSPTQKSPTPIKSQHCKLTAAATPKKWPITHPRKIWTYRMTKDVIALMNNP